MKRELLARIQALRNGKTPFVLITNLDTGSQQIFREEEPLGDLAQEIFEEARLALRCHESRVLFHDEARHFLQIFGPPPRLLLVGAVHISQSLCEMATIAGFDVTIIDPRRPYASGHRFGDVEISNEWPEQALRNAMVDHRCAIVTLAHDPKIDDPALCFAIRSNAFYVGALGSRKTHANRLKRLREHGFGESELERIRGPVGLAIGAVSPAEISVSILADIVSHLRSAPKSVSSPA